MSEDVNTLQAFVSHSWRDGRFKKYFSLLTLYNGNLALAVTLAFFFPTVLGVKYGILPLPTTTLEYGLAKKSLDPGLKYGVVCLIALFIYFMVLMFGHKLFEAIRGRPKDSSGLSTSTLFLDKCCIDQSDEAKKLEGIRTLGAWMANSERVVVLFSPDYFDRLWCAYELAVFLRLKGPETIDLLDLNITALVGFLAGLYFLMAIFMEGLAFGIGLGLIERTARVDGFLDNLFVFVDMSIQLRFS